MKNNPLNPFLPDDQWKFKAVEESRLAILEQPESVLIELLNLFT